MKMFFSLLMFLAIFTNTAFTQQQKKLLHQRHSNSDTFSSPHPGVDARTHVAHIGEPQQTGEVPHATAISSCTIIKNKESTEQTKPSPADPHKPPVLSPLPGDKRPIDSLYYFL